MHSDPADLALRRQVMNLFKPAQRYKQQTHADGTNYVPIYDDADLARVDAALAPSRAAAWLQLQLPQIGRITVLPWHDIAVPVNGIGGLEYIVHCYWKSLRSSGYNIMGHPNFTDYARGVMALRPLPCAPAYDASLNAAYPPRRLNGLEGSTLCWMPSQ